MQYTNIDNNTIPQVVKHLLFKVKYDTKLVELTNQVKL